MRYAARYAATSLLVFAASFGLMFGIAQAL